MRIKTCPRCEKPVKVEFEHNVNWVFPPKESDWPEEDGPCPKFKPFQSLETGMFAECECGKDFKLAKAIAQKIGKQIIHDLSDNAEKKIAEWFDRWQWMGEKHYDGVMNARKNDARPV